MFDVVVLEVVHHVSAIAFNLLVARHGTKDDLGETLRWKHVKTYTTYDSVIFD